MASVISPDDIDFARYLRETEAKQKVRPAREYMAEVVDDLLMGAQSGGPYLPWMKAGRDVQFQPQEVTLWEGVSGHGKSLIQGMVSASLMGQGQRVAIASFEMKPYKTLQRMARQWSGVKPSAELLSTPRGQSTLKEAYDQFGEWTDNKLWLYDQQGTTNPETVISIARYCAKELGINHIFVDSLMKCVRDEDDYNGQKQFVDELCALARDCNTHIHLVHHTKKLASDEAIPGKNDAKGSGSITDQVDNVLIMWRNLKKEREIQAGESKSAADPDALLICAKQRNGEWEGRLGLWFDKESQQFLGDKNDAPLNFSDFPHTSWS